MSLYADDAAVFINPTAHDMHPTKFILNLFSEASGLTTNMDKTEFYPIHCQDINMQEVLGADQVISSFPCSYLGLPLHFKRLPKMAVVPLVQ
jgi:hypothetical protein